MERQTNRLLLHCCCAPCALGGLFHVPVGALFFYNPNIWPSQEYAMRLNEMRKLAQDRGLHLIEGEYDHDVWLESLKGYENELEGGKRCLVCYEIRLRKTAESAQRKGYDSFATTLTLSPHKKAPLINTIGKKLEKELGIYYMESDFKKKGAYDFSIKCSKEKGIKRQNYCGCEFSRKRHASPSE